MKKWKQLPKWAKIFSILFLFLFVSEIILRFIIGLGDLAIYREDEQYEYFYEPNQDVWRFGNHIVTNEFGMRSNKVNKKKKFIILEFGDSVLNGGAHVDQDNLATTIEENKLNEKFKNQVQILNISAQSWGLSNAFAYLQKQGDFDADIIVLVFSSHDLRDNMHFRKVVGVHSAWPNQKPLLALTDLWTRFIWPKTKALFGGSAEYDYLKDFSDSKINPGWKNFFSYASKKKIPLLVYLHASKKEIQKGDFNADGKKIIRMCEEENVKVISDLDALNEMDDAFIDDIHMSEKGQSVMAELLLPVLEKSLTKIQ